MMQKRVPTFNELAENGRNAISTSKSHRRLHIIMGADYLAKTHKYRMRYGNGYIGGLIEMTGRKAKERNKAMIIKFGAELEKNPRARLCQWVWQKEPSDH